MIWGQFVGDAAALGAHWIYDLDDLHRAYPDGVHGFEAPREGHYHHGKRPGDQTHYGDAALLLLESVVELGRFNAADFARRFQAYFNDPACRVYRDHSTKDTLANLAANPVALHSGSKTDDQPATVTRLAPVVAVHGDDSDAVEALTRFSQDNDRAVAYALAHAHILDSFLRGSDFAAALETVEEEEPRAKIVAARADRDESILEATLSFGQGCPLPKSFPGAVHAMLKHPSDFRTATLETIAAGGDSAARASMIGAWIGAELGLQGVPAEWRKKLTAGKRIAESIARLSHGMDEQ
jgi:ADP-ribosylglycohydrolase